jgi:hypothetical protein
MKKHILSKSTFMAGIQCQKRLYLSKFRRDLLPEEVDEQQQAIFDAGIDTGLLAQQLFPNGIDASPLTPFDYQKSVKRTQSYLMTNDVIYEACFQYEGALCAIDILVRKDDLWYAFEVKGTNSVKPQHITDAAFQYYVMTRSGLPLGDISIVHFNSSYVRRGDLDVQALFTATSVLNEVIGQQESVKENIGVLKAMLAAKVEPVVEVGTHCTNPYECPFIDHCWKDVAEEESEELSTEATVDTFSLQGFVSELKYPLYYFDFETAMYGIPPYDESSPWQALPFQYSLHKQQKPQSTCTHTEYIGDGKSDPREALILKLINDLGTKGTILAWHASFEISCLKGLIRNFPQYEKPLQSIIHRMVDLKIPFSKKWIDIPACKGSASIKVVLPVFIPELSYEDLDIQEGMTASFVYSQLQYQDEATQQTQQKQLLEYCKLDTFAMVRIFEKINQIILKN